MKVSHVSNATRLWVTLLEHTSHNETISLRLHSEIELKRLTLDLAQYYSASENRLFQGTNTFTGSLLLRLVTLFYLANPLEGSYYGYHSEDGLFFRVQVLKFSRPLGFYFPHKERARVSILAC